MTKENLNEIFKNLFSVSKKAFKSGVDVSKVAIDKAGKAATKFGDESILKIEIKQLEFQIKKSMRELGKYVYESFANEKRASVSAEDSVIVKLLEDIKNAEKEIGARVAKLKAQTGSDFVPSEDDDAADAQPVKTEDSDLEDAKA